MKRKFLVVSTFMVLFIFLGGSDLLAQCPMCRMSAESNLEHGGTMGKGLNSGILYMLAIPYLLVACLGIIWYKNRKKTDEEVLEVPDQ